MSVMNELLSLEAFLKLKFPESSFEKQKKPEDTFPGLFVVGLQSGDPSLETRLHYVNRNDWQINYFGETPLEVLTVIEQLNKAFHESPRMIPLLETARNMRIMSFSTSQPFETADKNYAFIGVLTTETRITSEQPVYEAIGEVNVREIKE